GHTDCRRSGRFGPKTADGPPTLSGARNLAEHEFVAVFDLAVRNKRGVAVFRNLAPEVPDGRARGPHPGTELDGLHSIAPWYCRDVPGRPPDRFADPQNRPALGAGYSDGTDTLLRCRRVSGLSVDRLAVDGNGGVCRRLLLRRSGGQRHVGLHAGCGGQVRGG